MPPSSSKSSDKQDSPSAPTRPTWLRWLVRATLWMVGLATAAAVGLALTIAVALAVAYPNLPPITSLTDYRPKLPLRVFSADAVLLAARILNALDYVGVMGVELFVTPQGLIVNEIAPRVHNSGHWTQNGCAVDQFEQHIRAVAGLPLGDGARHSDVVMENLIGDDIARVPLIARERNAALHLYGKAEARPGRKMGHVNRIQPR